MIKDLIQNKLDEVSNTLKSIEGVNVEQFKGRDIIGLINIMKNDARIGTVYVHPIYKPGKPVEVEDTIGCDLQLQFNGNIQWVNTLDPNVIKSNINDFINKIDCSSNK